MVKKDISLIKHQDEIVNSYLGGMKFDEICKRYNISYNEFIAVLGYTNTPISKRHLSKEPIDGENIIIIGDTHIGNPKENIGYIEQTYNFAEKNNIHNVVHVGDLFQSGINPVKREYQDPDRQFAYFQRVYPSSSNIKTHVLFGNHDLKLLDKEDQYLKVLESRKDFNVLGFKRAYFLWGKYLLSLYHEIKHYHVNIPNVDTTLTFEGHRHAFSTKGKTIYVPTLSDDKKKYYGSISEPGFLVGLQEKNSIDVDYLSFEGGHLHNKGLVYQHRK